MHASLRLNRGYSNEIDISSPTFIMIFVSSYPQTLGSYGQIIMFIISVAA